MNDTYIKEFEDWLLMGSWDVDTACKILAGYFPVAFDPTANIMIDVYSDKGGYKQTSNGEAPTEAQQNEYHRIYALFKSDEHDFAAVGLDGKRLFPQSHVDIMKSTVRPCYAIDWAASKRIQPTWLDEAREKDFPVDMPQSESKKEKPKEQEPTQEELGEKKEENLLRLIGILKNMLSDEEVIKQLKKDSKAFKKQKELNQYISGLYGEDLPSKGLEPATLNKIWGTANKILKED